MKVSVKTLKQLTGLTNTPKEISEMIEQHIGAVDGTHNLESDYENIVVAEIIEKRDHPNADNLGIYKINYGTNEPIQVLAGDKTLQVGDKVAYLKPGAIVPISIYTEEKPFVISTMKMRGEMSNGMMGSEKELNLGPDHTVVMKLPHDAPVGEDFAKYYNLDDFIIDIENKGLTNRGDLFGLLGLAKELAAINGINLPKPSWYITPNLGLKPEDNCLSIDIINDAENICRRYTAITMDNITVKESPLEMRTELIKAGIKPINNVVDITNYIAILTGQPLHAFDYDKVLKNDPNSDEIVHIVVRSAKTGEKIHTLDDKVHELSDRTTVIADSVHPIAIAGIIGGWDTQIDSNTKRIIIECANFDKSNIRKSTMELGIFTDSSTIYKHALDTNQCLSVLSHTVELLKELANGKIASEIIDLNSDISKQQYIDISINNVNKHLGTDLEKTSIKEILTNLGYIITQEDDDILTLQIPQWRKDLEIAEDIHEDIGRIYGYSNIKLQLPSRKITPSKRNSLFETKRILGDTLQNIGANELTTYNFTDITTIQKCNQDTELAYHLKNALAPELSFMRTSILSTLISKAGENIQRGINDFALYESNIAHHKNVLDKDGIPAENWYLSFLFTTVTKQLSGSSYYEAKRYLEVVLKSLGLKDLNYKLVANTTEQNLDIWVKNLLPIFDPNRSALIYFEGNLLGIVGEIDIEVRENFKLNDFTCGFELNINTLSELKIDNSSFRDIPKYPVVTKDLCFEMNKDVEYENVKSIIQNSINNEELWGNVECLDIYMKDLEDDLKRITFRVSVRNYNKTLKDKDIVNILKKIEKNVINKFQATLI